MPDSHPSDYLVAYCTCPHDQGGDIALHLLKKKVCACVNIVPGVRSLFTWKDAIEEDLEDLLVIKTREDRFEALEAAVAEVHPYDVFELIASRVDRGTEAYLNWVGESV